MNRRVKRIVRSIVGGLASPVEIYSCKKLTARTVAPHDEVLGQASADTADDAIAALRSDWERIGEDLRIVIAQEEERENEKASLRPEGGEKSSRKLTTLDFCSISDY